MERVYENKLAAGPGRDIIHYEGQETAINAATICGTCTSDNDAFLCSNNRLASNNNQRYIRVGKNGRIEDVTGNVGGAAAGVNS